MKRVPCALKWADPLLCKSWSRLRITLVVAAGCGGGATTKNEKNNNPEFGVGSEINLMSRSSATKALGAR